MYAVLQKFPSKYWVDREDRSCVSPVLMLGTQEQANEFLQLYKPRYEAAMRELWEHPDEVADEPAFWEKLFEVVNKYDINPFNGAVRDAYFEIVLVQYGRTDVALA